MDPSSSNAVPSSSSSLAPSWSRYLLQPDNPHPSALSGTQDLLTTFHLDSVYNTFLRPYLDPALLSSASGGVQGALPAFGAADAGGGVDSPAPSPGRIEVGNKGKGKAVESAPAPVPAAAASPAPGAGLKITLGGIKFGAGGGRGGSPSPSPSVGPPGAGEGTGGAGAGKPAKRLKMEKGFEWMVGDVLGLPPSSRRTTVPPNFLQSLILNPDPAPCPALVPLDGGQLREAFTLDKGGLAGFDMGVWEGRPAVGSVGGGEKKKKKKRKNDHPPGDGSDPKKQRR
ncbi:hypothetical protein JCM11251_007031 [Rhodosporidiobolus azoricus]